MLRATGHVRMVRRREEPMLEESASARELRAARCRFTTYRHRFARAAPAPRAKRKIRRIVDVHRPSKPRASRVSPRQIIQGPANSLFSIHPHSPSCPHDLKSREGARGAAAYKLRQPSQH